MHTANKTPTHSVNQKETVKKYAHYKPKEIHAANIQHAAALAYCKQERNCLKKLHTGNKRITRCKLQTNHSRPQSSCLLSRD